MDLEDSNEFSRIESVKFKLDISCIVRHFLDYDFQLIEFFE